MGVFQNNLMGAAAAAASAGGADFYDHQIANSCRFQDSANSHMYVSMGTATNVDKYTFSTWFKHCDWTNGEGFVFSIGSGTLENLRYTYNSGNATFYGYVGNNGSYTFRTSAAFRDPSSWYHLVFTYDSTQSTAADRVKLYVNGVSQSFSDTGYTSMSQNQNSNSDQGSFYLNRQVTWGSGTSNEAYFAETIFVDGTGYAASDFGEEKNGVWIPKDPSELSFGNNGFYLKYESSSDLGNDSSGNNNDLTVGNISSHDHMLDSPTFNSDSNGGNFCTINPIYRGDQTSDAKYGTLSEGNLKHSYSSSSDATRPCTIKVPASGKWYFEYLINGGGGTSNYSPAAGIIDPNTYTMNGGNYNDTGTINYLQNTHTVRKSGTQTGAYSGSRGSNGDVMGIAVDMDNGAFYVSKNGTFYTISGGSQGDPTSGASRTGAGATWTPASEFTSGMVPLSAPTGGSQPIITMNFGQDGTFAGEKTAGNNSDTNGYGNFFSAVPSGYSAICTGALTVVDEIDPAQTDDNYPQKLFGPYTYVGNNDGDRTVSTDFQADKVWIKVRSIVDNHYIQDSTRGFGFSKSISPNATGAQGAQGGAPSSTKVDSVSSSNMVVTGADFTYSSATYVAWLWRANGGTTSTNTNGSVNSTVQVDPSGHFSIVKYEGQNDSWGNAETIGHGLSSAPTCMLLKNYDKADEWQVFFSDYGNASIGGSNAASNSLVLNSNANLYTNQSYKGWGGVMPTSTVFTVDGNNANGSGESIVVYCFANCEGYIKSGTYQGNGESSDGTFVYTGFKPAWILVKRLSGSKSWLMQDNARDTYNPIYHLLKPNTTAAEEAYTDGTDYNDFLSNGFKVARGGDAANWNADGETYVFLAMAHNPFKYATSR